MNLVMLGTGTFAEPTFRALLDQDRHSVVGLVTQPDRDAGHQRGSTRQVGEGMKAMAQARGVPVYQPESINTPEGVAQLKAWNAELLVTAAYGQILKKEVLEAARLGGINVHASLLPKYRGAAPVAWAIWHGETRTGVTIIRMTTGLDAGDMLAQETIDILPDETAGELEARLSPLGAKLALDVIEKLAAGSVVGVKQDSALVTKAPKLTKEHGLINWSLTAERIACHVRAMQPWPTAYTFLHRPGKSPVRVIISRAAALPPTLTLPHKGGGKETPGAIVVNQTQLHVLAGDEPLEVLALQPAGKKRMSAADFLRGHPLRPGDRFGS